MKTTHERAVSQYSMETLEKILADYQRRDSKDRWDVARIAAIRAELQRRRKGMGV
jgi:hypothetical protein